MMAKANGQNVGGRQRLAAGKIDGHGMKENDHRLGGFGEKQSAVGKKNV